MRRSAYDPFVDRLDRRWLGRLLAAAGASLVVATLVVGLLQDVVGVPNPSAVYLVAVVVTAFVGGASGAVVASVAAFLLYNFLFTEPRYTFAIHDPNAWLSVVLLLFVGVVVGQLAALQRSRTELAEAREREAVGLFRVSRTLATRVSTPAVLADLATIVRDQTAMRRVWIALGSDDAAERVAADTEAGAPPPPVPGIVQQLRRMPGDTPAEWARIHRTSGRTRPGGGEDAWRVRIEAGGATLGSVWALRDRALGLPDRTETRLLAAAADQIGQALAHDRLAAEGQAAEIVRQSDALKSALLQSVSHDLRTPLATIRAAAGTLRPDAGLPPDDRRESAEAIEREVEYLDRLVTNLLDLSRIEAGALRAERDAFELDDLVGQVADRAQRQLGGRTLELAVDAPPVLVDPIFLVQAVANVLDNATKHTPPEARIAVTAHELGDGLVRLSIEDDGPGVPTAALTRLFDRFYRVPGAGGGSRAGTGIGLAVARGLIEAMDGRIAARAGERGGLAIDLDLPLAAIPTAAVEPLGAGAP